MEFHISMPIGAVELDAIEQAIGEIDPAVVIDVDSTGRKLRVATSLDADELVAVFVQAGYPVDMHQVTQLPSICCGGCSG